MRALDFIDQYSYTARENISRCFSKLRSKLPRKSISDCLFGLAVLKVFRRPILERALNGSSSLEDFRQMIGDCSSIVEKGMFEPYQESEFPCTPQFLLDLSVVEGLCRVEYMSFDAYNESAIR